MNVSHPLTAAPPSILHRLPPPLNILVTQYLPLPDKLLQLTHMCCAFPVLTPSCFAFDTIAWTPTLIAQLTDGPSAPLLALLSQVPHALYVDSISDSFRALCALLQSPSAACPFPALRAITIAPTAPTSQWLSQAPFPPSLLAGLSHCRHITALHLRVEFLSNAGEESLLSSLPLFPVLRTLRLSGPHKGHLTDRQLLVLLSLPLTSLDLRCVHVDLSSPPPNPFPSLHLLRTLLLPSTNHRPCALQWQQALLSSLTMPYEGTDAQLERLFMPDVQSSNLCYLPYLRQLHTLQLRLPRGRDAAISDFYLALTASSLLTLRHLRLEHHMLSQYDEQAAHQALLPGLLPIVVSAYAGQLLTLELLVGPSDGWADETYVKPPQELAEAMTAALLSCHSLRRLLVTDWWLSSSAAPPICGALPHLESLELEIVTETPRRRVGERMDLLDEATLAILLDAAPHLQELHLRAQRLPCDVLLWTAARCHELRTLQMSTCRRTGFSSHSYRGSLNQE